jgi:hypothetical protein
LQTLSHINYLCSVFVVIFSFHIHLLVLESKDPRFSVSCVLQSHELKRNICLLYAANKPWWKEVME